MSVDKNLLSPCGLYCGVCAVYIAHKEDNSKFKEKLSPIYLAKPEDLHCTGCMSRDEDQIFFFCKMCNIKSCVKERNLEGCYQCDDFPCDHINNFPFGPGKKEIFRTIPRWKELGTEAWVKEEEARFTCSHCGNRLFRGAKKCNKCNEPLNL